jgi:hypothetical protein
MRFATLVLKLYLIHHASLSLDDMLACLEFQGFASIIAHPFKQLSRMQDCWVAIMHSCPSQDSYPDLDWLTSSDSPEFLFQLGSLPRRNKSPLRQFRYVEDELLARQILHKDDYRYPLDRPTQDRTADGCRRKYGGKGR